MYEGVGALGIQVEAEGALVWKSLEPLVEGNGSQFFQVDVPLISE